MKIINFIEKRIITGAAFAFSGRLLSIFIVICINSTLIKLYPHAIVGQYYLVLSTVFFFAIISQFGLSTAATKLIAQYKSEEKYEDVFYLIKRSSKIIMSLSLGTGFLLFAGLYKLIVVFLLHDTELLEFSFLVIVWIPIFSFQNYIAECFRGMGKIGYASILGGTFTCGALPGTLYIFLLIFWQPLGLSGVLNTALLAWSCSLALSAFILHRVLRRERNCSIGRICPSTKKHDAELRKITIPALCINLNNYIIMQADVWILGIFMGAAFVGFFGSITRLAFVVGFPLMILNSVVAPVIAEYFFNNKIKELESLLRRVALLCSLVSLAFLFTYVIWGQEILQLVYDEKISTGTTLLIILSLGRFANVLCGSCGLVLLYCGQQRAMMIIATCSAFSYLLLGAAGVALSGMNGLAISITLVLLGQNLIMLQQAKSRANILTFAGV